jgi:hypothetical protein
MIPDNPIAPEVYEISVTDVTGSLTSLNGVYSTSGCISVSDLYPKICGPFQLSITATNSMGRERAHFTTPLRDTLTPCGCYREKGNNCMLYRVVLLSTGLFSEQGFFSSATTPTSANLTYTCSGYNFVIFSVVQTNNAVVSILNISCNSTKQVSSLIPATNYTVIGGGKLTCSVHHFMTGVLSCCPMKQPHVHVYC